jgi:3-phosphoglycerate kinase
LPRRFAPRNDQNWAKVGVLQKSEHIIAGGSVQATCLRVSHRQVGKSAIRGKKLTKAKKYSLTGT